MEKSKSFQQEIINITNIVEAQCVNSMTVAKANFEPSIAVVITSIEETLEEFESAYLKEFYVKARQGKRSINNKEAKDNLSFNFDISLIEKEATLDLLAPPSWNSIDYVAYQNLIITGDMLGNLGVWDASSLKNLMTEKYHEGPVNNVVYYKKGGYILTASDDAVIKVLEIETIEATPRLKTVAEFKEHKEKVWSLLIDEDNGTLYSSGKEASILVWDLKTLTLKHKLDTHGKGDTGTQMALIPKLNLLAVSFLQGTIGLFDINTSGMFTSEVFTIKVHQKWLHSLIYIKERDELLVGTDAGTINIWKVGNCDFQPINQYTVPGGLPTSIEVISNGKKILVASGQDSLFCLDLETGERSTVPDLGIYNLKTVKVVQKERKLILASEGVNVMACHY